MHGALLFAALLQAPPSESVAVMPLQATQVPPEVVRTLDDSLVVLVARLGPYRTISPADLDAQLGRERMKEVAGCPPDSLACASEIVGALGTRFVLSGSVTKTQALLRVTLTLMDTRTQEAKGRGQGVVDDDARNYEELLDMALREVFGLPKKPKSEIAFGGALRAPAAVQIPESQGLSASDVKVEQLLEQALDAQENPAVTPQQRADAWCALAASKSKNAYQKPAEAACKEWKGFAKAWAERMAALSTQYATLRDYLRLKRKTAEQKQAAIDAFLTGFVGVDAFEMLEAKAARARLVAGDTLQGTPSCLAECVTLDRCVPTDFTCRAPTSDADRQAAEQTRAQALAAWNQTFATVAAGWPSSYRIRWLDGGGHTSVTHTLAQKGVCVLSMRRQQTDADSNSSFSASSSQEVEVPWATLLEASLRPRPATPGSANITTVDLILRASSAKLHAIASDGSSTQDSLVARTAVTMIVPHGEAAAWQGKLGALIATLDRACRPSSGP